MTIKPQRDNILVRRIVAPEMKGGLYLPQSAQGTMEAASQGIVLATGPGAHEASVARVGMGDTADYYRPMSVKPGDYVLFTRHAGIEVDADGDKLLLMSEGAVIATLVEEPAA